MIWGYDGIGVWERMGIWNNWVWDSEFKWFYYNKEENFENMENILWNMLVRM